MKPLRGIPLSLEALVFWPSIKCKLPERQRRGSFGCRNGRKRPRTSQNIGRPEKMSKYLAGAMIAVLAAAVLYAGTASADQISKI
jgi:hypothetical protein